LTSRFFIPNEFSLLNRALFTLLGGFFLLVLIAQNLVYLNIPVRISAWSLSALALVQVCLYREKLLAWKLPTLISTSPFWTMNMASRG